MANNLFIDLFAGLGGASQAFIDRSGWTVVQIDNNPDLLAYNHRLIMADVLDIEAVMAIIDPLLHNVGHVVLWASPPCLEFSLAYSAPGPVAARAGVEFEPSLDCLNAAIAVRDWLTQRGVKLTWVIENVRGASPHFQPILGAPRQIVASFFLWGNFTPLAFADRSVFKHTKTDIRHSPIRANERAKVPWDVSQALFESVTVQRSLEAWLNQS